MAAVLTPASIALLTTEERFAIFTASTRNGILRANLDTSTNLFNGPTTGMKFSNAGIDPMRFPKRFNDTAPNLLAA